jgi:hypothetical protein
MKKIRVERYIDVPRAWIWDILGSYDKSPSKSFRLEITKRGDALLHGVGTERILYSGRRKVYERITSAKPQEFFEYEILSGLPLDYYRGRAEFFEQRSGTRIIWAGEYNTRNILTSLILGHAIKLTINKTIDGLRDQYKLVTGGNDI